MKKYLVAMVLCFLMRAAHSQMLIGLKQGLNISSISYRERYDQAPQKMGSNSGYAGGLVFQYFSEKYLGIQAELFYSEKGFKTIYDTLNDIQYERVINYISLPMLAHFYISKGTTSPYLLLGVFAGYALSSTEVFRDGANTSRSDYVFKSERDNKWEYGLTGGAGFKGNFSFGTLQIDCTYSYTLNSLYKWDYQNNDPAIDRYFKIPEEALNTNIQISLSYLIPLKKNTFK